MREAEAGTSVWSGRGLERGNISHYEGRLTCQLPTCCAVVGVVGSWEQGGVVGGGRAWPGEGGGGGRHHGVGGGEGGREGGEARHGAHHGVDSWLG